MAESTENTPSTNVTGTAYSINRITLLEEPNVENVATSQVNQFLNDQELESAEKILSAGLPFEAKLINSFNNKKEEIQSRLIPFIIKQLSGFGSTATQFITNNLDSLNLEDLSQLETLESEIDSGQVDTSQIENESLTETSQLPISPQSSTVSQGILQSPNASQDALQISPTSQTIPASSQVSNLQSAAASQTNNLQSAASSQADALKSAAIAAGVAAGTAILLKELKRYANCPNQPAILGLINKRNSVAIQINNLYQSITTINKIVSTSSTILAAIQVGITAIQTVPYPATGIPPLGLPPLTSGTIEVVGATADELTKKLNSAQITLTSLTLTAASFGALLGVVLLLLKLLDVLIRNCSKEKNLPFETINSEINNAIVGSSQIIKQTQQDLTYKGFKLELQLDKASTSKYPRRFAQALNNQGVPVLKTDLSFASDPQVLINQLKFIIDSNPNLTAE